MYEIPESDQGRAMHVVLLCRRVDRPRSRVEGTDMLVLEGECARGRQERGSRKSPNGTKGIKGFTGFTSFGLEQRPSFRKTHPYASSQAIEKVRPLFFACVVAVPLRCVLALPCLQMTQ